MSGTWHIAYLDMHVAADPYVQNWEDNKSEVYPDLVAQYLRQDIAMLGSVGGVVSIASVDAP